MSKGPVGLGHLVGVFFSLDRRAGVVGCIEQFGSQLLRHRLAAALAGIGDQPAVGKGLPAIPTGAFFTSWNGEIATQVTAKGQWLTDIHGLFAQHGFNHPPKWYANDCTHPNTTGHDQLRRHFYFKITGESLP